MDDTKCYGVEDAGGKKASVLFPLSLYRLNSGQKSMFASEYASVCFGYVLGYVS